MLSLDHGVSFLGVVNIMKVNKYVVVPELIIGTIRAVAAQVLLLVRYMM